MGRYYEPEAVEQSPAWRSVGGGSERERCVDGDHRHAARADRFDDLGVIDALQLDGRDAEVALA
jgi:hypothetical protein